MMNKKVRSTTIYSKEGSQNKYEMSSEIQNAGKLIKERREELGLLRTDLSFKTRISVNVIQALENGWLNCLPERAYLSKMLTILEKELSLEEDSLKSIIIDGKKNQSRGALSLLIPRTIDIVSGRQGNILYITAILLSLFIINRQQFYLSINNGNTTSPLNIEKEVVKKR